MVDLSMAMLNNQMVYIYIYTYTRVTQQISPFINPTVDGCDILHQKDGWTPINNGIPSGKLT